jgi:ATP-binding cassette subfamily F protein uup
VMGLDGQGGAQIFADYWQWEQAQFTQKQPKTEKQVAVPRPLPAPGKKKLSYMEAREWEQMEERILEAETELEAIRAEMQSPEVVSDGLRLHTCYEKLQPAEAAVQALYARWAELEAKQA